MTDWPGFRRKAIWIVGGLALIVGVGALSFCVTLRAGGRSSVVAVPDWSGRTRDDAAAEARGLGLGFEVAGERHDAEIGAGRVVLQEPAAGTNVRRGRMIRVTVSSGGERLTVPGVTGQPARQADLEIRRQGLASGWESHIHDARHPAGRVIGQVPAAGASAVTGERVDRLVSDGARASRWVMPDLAGRPLRVAQEWITLCGFRAGTVRRVSGDGRPSGTVIGQRPIAGWPIERNDVVELTVAE
jgi:eukaryotic-like serine/threonine-protein kinase